MSLIQSVPSGYQSAVIENVQLAVSGSTGALLVDEAGCTMKSGTIAITTSGALSAVSVPCKAVFVQGQAGLSIGDSIAQPITLTSGFISLPVSNLNQVYAAITSGTVAFLYFA
jgi:hypothetical protein